MVQNYPNKMILNMVGEEITLLKQEIELINLILYWKEWFYLLLMQLLNGVKNQFLMLLVNLLNGLLKLPLVLMMLKSPSEMLKKELVILWLLMINISSKEKFWMKINMKLNLWLLIMWMELLFLELIVKILLLVIVLLYGLELMLLKFKKP